MGKAQLMTKESDDVVAVWKLQVDKFKDHQSSMQRDFDDLQGTLRGKDDVILKLREDLEQQKDEIKVALSRRKPTDPENRDVATLRNENLSLKEQLAQALRSVPTTASHSNASSRRTTINPQDTAKLEIRHRRRTSISAGASLKVDLSLLTKEFSVSEEVCFCFIFCALVGKRSIPNVPRA